jgi:aminodeoxyfutalosine deaminase
MFSTTLDHEYAVAAELLELDAAGVAGLARQAVHQSFADAGLQRRILAEIDVYCAAVIP